MLIKIQISIRLQLYGPRIHASLYYNVLPDLTFRQLKRISFLF